MNLILKLENNFNLLPLDVFFCLQATVLAQLLNGLVNVLSLMEAKICSPSTKKPNVQGDSGSFYPKQHLVLSTLQLKSVRGCVGNYVVNLVNITREIKTLETQLTLSVFGGARFRGARSP